MTLNSTCPKYETWVRMGNKTFCVRLCPELNSWEWYEAYSRFSIIINGVLMTALIVFGCVGNVLMLRSIQRNRTQQRLCWHVRLLGFWDTCLLISMLAFCAVPNIIQKVAKLYGYLAYVYRIFLPVGNIASNASRWQLLAIAAERFLAVTNPFSRYATGTKSLRTICVCIALGSLILHLPIAFEMTISHCYHAQSKKLYPALSTNQPKHTELYNLLVHVVPDFIFRSPIPFALIVFFTVGTLYGRRKSPLQGSSDSHRHAPVSRGWSTPVLLMILNFKFIVCHSLPVVYDIMRLSGANDYKRMFYMADISNFLSTVQTATNWIIFIQWRSQRPLASGRRNTGKVFSPDDLNRLARLYADSSTQHQRVAVQLLQLVERENPELLRMFEDVQSGEKETGSPTAESQLERAAALMREFTDQKIMAQLTAIPSRMHSAREQLVTVGELLCEKSIKIDNSCWTEAKTLLLDCLLNNRGYSFQDRAAGGKFVSFLIRELKYGKICEKTRLSSRSVTHETMV